MQHAGQILTCLDLLDLATKRGMSDSEICNKAKALKVKISRTTLWRIRNGKLTNQSYLSTLLKLATVLAHAK